MHGEANLVAAGGRGSGGWCARGGGCRHADRRARRRGASVQHARSRPHGSDGRFSYLVAWRKTGGPTAFHIHRGRAGANGPVVINLLAKGDVRGNFARGSVLVKGGLLRDIRNDPRKWYADLHTAHSPDGALRGQLRIGDRR
ncbi:CHRD domain-containing protein [Streptosporangium sp. NPDC023963]|uniref:CHRD domain-containing protein n=1 Tax=Streptosporangium sp. NPDC023963 TaxID=3155608 RepID=UPI00341F8965